MQAEDEGGVALRAWAALVELLQAKGLITESERIGVIAKAHGLGAAAALGALAQPPELHCTD